jgi:hypothetical protein
MYRILGVVLEIDPKNLPVKVIIGGKSKANISIKINIYMITFANDTLNIKKVVIPGNFNQIWRLS